MKAMMGLKLNIAVGKVISRIRLVYPVLVLFCLLNANTGFTNEAGRQLTEFPFKPDIPLLVLHNTHGQTIDIKQLRQSVVVINFWASWCPSCVSELRVMHDTAASLVDRDVVVLAVNVGDNINMINHYFEEYQPAYQVLLDEQSKTTADWQIMGLPTTYVIGPDRKIHYGAIGVLAWESDQVVQTILELRNGAE
jgi:thiol-disulfide isomerase/thioredoxin